MTPSRRRLIATCAVGALAIIASLVYAADRKSPHATVTAKVGSAQVSVSYGRPFKKGRAIFGGLVPWNQVWRTGADEATTLTTDGDLLVGDLRVPKGTYTMFTLPTEKGMTLIVNSVPKQWGAYEYDEKKDVGRVPMTVRNDAAPVEQLTLSIAPAGDGKATLQIAWDKTAATVTLAPAGAR